MADNSSLPVASGNETFANNDIGGVKYPRVKATWGPAGTSNDADVATGKPLPVQVRSATGLIPIGEPTDAKSTATDTTSASAISVLKQISASVQAPPSQPVTNAGTFPVQAAATEADGANVTLGAKADAKSTATDTTAITAMSVWKQISASVQALVTAFGAAWTRGAGASDGNTQRVTIDSGQIGSLGSAASASSAPVVLASDQAWPKGLSNKAFSAAFSTLTRPANTTAYTAGDSISDNATAGSVTALSATVSDVNDDPMFISEILVTSTDTGLAGKRIRAYLYNSDPTASSGVSGGDNVAFSNKKAGYIGSMSGRMEAGFSDGTPGRLVPSYQLAADTTDLAGAPASGFIVTKPTSGAKTLFVQFQAIDAFTPSASSTTIIATIRGWQARAA